jgi:hypothetical protein
MEAPVAITTMQQLLELKAEFPRPEGLIRIVLNGTNNGEVRPNNHHRKGGRHPRSSSNRGRRGQHPHHRGNKRWGRGPALQQSENSFSAARKRLQDQPQAQKLIGEIRGLLNKVTAENYEAIKEEINQSDLIDYANDLEDDDMEEFLTEIAKLFVNKSKVDHEFSGLYAEIAREFTEKMDMFGDILYEVCREAIPTSRYDPDRKRGYLGALLLLVEMRRVELISSGGIAAFVDRLLAAIERCNPDTVFSVQNESDKPMDPVKQVEVCIELICKFFPVFLANEWPDWAEKYLSQLKELQAQKDRVKPRSRFMLMDFFKEVKEVQEKK